MSKNLISLIALFSFTLTVTIPNYLFALSFAERRALRAPEAKKIADIDKAIKASKPTILKAGDWIEYIYRNRQAPGGKVTETGKILRIIPPNDILVPFAIFYYNFMPLIITAVSWIADNVNRSNEGEPLKLLKSLLKKKTDKESYIRIIRKKVFEEMPYIRKLYTMKKYLSEPETELLRSEFYKITKGHFEIWGLAGALSKSKSVVPYFNGSHLEALITSFPELELKKEGFKRNDYKVNRSIVGNVIPLSILLMIPILMGISLIVIKGYLPITLGEAGIVITIFSLSLMKVVSISHSWSLDDIAKTTSKTQLIPHYLLISQ